MAALSVIDKVIKPSGKDANMTSGADFLQSEIIPCSIKVEQTLDLPTNALLTRVEVEVVAMPAGECLLSQVAEARPMQSDSKTVVIDLKRMRSVAGLDFPKAITSIKSWSGARFIETNIRATGASALFAEIATERLAVSCASTIDIDAVQESGTIILPDAPADLVLTVNGKTAWTHIGPVQLTTATDRASGAQIVLDTKDKNRLVENLLRELADLADGSGSENVILHLLKEYGIALSKQERDILSKQMQRGLGKQELTVKDVEAWLAKLGVAWPGQDVIASRMFSAMINITGLLQDELNAGAKELLVELKAALACRLQLTIPTQEYLRSHQVVFPAQVLSLDIAEEGEASLALPLPAASADWQVRTIQCTVKGNAGRSRIVPAVGPQPLDLGHLALDGDHALAALLSTNLLEGLHTIEGVRLPLLVEEGGAEITAFLRSADNGKVGAPLAGALFQSQALTQSTNEQWVMLPLEKPHKVEPETDLWLELQAIRGRCWWALGNPSGVTAGVVSLQRGVPGGSFSPFILTLNNQPQHLHGRLRLMGQPLTDGAIPAIRVIDPHSGADLAGITTGSGPLAVEAHFAQAVRPANGILAVPLLLHAPGSYTVTEARVIYEQ